MKQKTLYRIFLALSLAFALLAIFQGVFSHNNYFFQNSTGDFYHFNTGHFIGIYVSLALGFLSATLFLERNYRITRWLLFAVAISAACFSGLYLHSRLESSVLLIAVLVLVFLGVVISLFRYLPNKVWTKWACFSICTLAFIGSIVVTVDFLPQKNSRHFVELTPVLKADDGTKLSALKTEESGEDVDFILTEEMPFGVEKSGITYVSSVAISSRIPEKQWEVVDSVLYAKYFLAN